MKHIHVLVIGALGQLGRAIHDFYELHKHNMPYVDIKYIDVITSENYPWVEQLDAFDIEELEGYLIENQINYIVNCAAYTNVDKAEDDYGNAYKLNAKLPEQLAIICRNLNIPFIHISTDYVYGGVRNIPYVEDEDFFLIPDSVYGITKFKGEKLVKKNTKDYIILRTSWLYYKESPTSFPAKISHKLNDENPQNIYVVDDQIGTPTYALNLARAIIDIIFTNPDGFRVYDKYSDTINRSGVYNYSDMGVCSWYDFASKIEEIMYPNQYMIFPCSSDKYTSKVKRPSYSVMNKNKFSKVFPYHGFWHWTWGLKDMIMMK